MAASEAQILANQANAQRSTGPKTPEGKERSRANGLKHGLTGSGVVIPPEDADEVESLTKALKAEFDPKTIIGAILVRQLAKLSVRMERGGRQETAALAIGVRHAAEEFDEARLDEAEGLFDGLADNPRSNLRKLRKSPEGVDRLILGWQEIRNDLTREPRPLWTAWHLERALNLKGLKIDEGQGSRLKVLSQASWGDFGALADSEGGEMDSDIRKAWARGKLIELIDAEIAELAAHYETLDFETIDLDRAQAPDLALFDGSREAVLARRYEAEAHRGFFKALKELRHVEAEHAAKPAPAPASKLASSWDGPSPIHRERSADLNNERMTPQPRSLPPLLGSVEPVRGSESQLMKPGQPCFEPV